MTEETTVRVYLDTNIISRLFDWRVKETAAHALAKIAESGRVIFATSPAVLLEVEQTVNSARRSLLRFAIALFDKLRWQPIADYSGALGTTCLGASYFGGGFGWQDPLLSLLLQVFDSEDATHIAQAKLSACDYFMTLDATTILTHRCTMSPELSAALEPFKIVSPEELAATLGLSDL